MPRMRFPPSLQIKKKILQQIWSGGYLPGQRLPMIADIAKQLGVSTSTVQKAVHELREEGVVECRHAQGIFLRMPDPMRAGRRRIGLITQSTKAYMENPGYPGDVLAELQKVLEPAGYRLEIHYLSDMGLLDLVPTVQKKRWAGVLLFEIENDVLIWELRQLLLPMVSIDYDAYHMAISSVKFDNLHGAYQATQHLIEQGHRRISFFRPFLRQSVGPFGFLNRIDDERLSGYTLAMQIAGLPVRVHEMEHGWRDIRQALEGMLGKPDFPTAFVCVSDFYAKRTAQQLQALGLEVPADASVIGFGGYGNEFAPGKVVSSMRVDAAGMGKAAGELMLARLERPYSQGERRAIPMTLTPRDSTCPAETAPSILAAGPDAKGENP